jgi:hypothetical protein
MKNPSKPTSFPPADVSDAKEALRNGEERPIGWYLEDAAEILSRISDCLDPSNSTPNTSNLQFRTEPPGTTTNRPELPKDDFDEWIGSRAQVDAAIKAGAAKLLGCYLRDLGDFLSRLAPAFNPPEHSRDWHFKFHRKGRGRRSDPMERLLRDSSSTQMLWKATREAGKQESAIADLKGRPGASRANLFKRKRRAQREK